MATRDPEVVDAGGKRQIAAHYYPLIGPYDSADRDVIEYHLLMMKLSGIDGVLIDWYGAHEVRDYGGNRRNAEALIARLARLDEVGLDFAMVYEDFTAEYAADTALVAAQADLRYARDQYFRARALCAGGSRAALARVRAAVVRDTGGVGTNPLGDRAAAAFIDAVAPIRRRCSLGGRGIRLGRSRAHRRPGQLLRRARGVRRGISGLQRLLPRRRLER